MTRRKKILLGIVGAVLVLVATPVVALAITWAGDSNMTDADLGPHAKQVKDGFVSVGMIDVGVDGGVALVDCANDKKASAILAELSRRKLGEGDVKAIFVTHRHGDHIGGCARFPNAEVYAMAAEKDAIEKEGLHVHPLSDGEAITIGDMKIEAFALPGHTPGSAVYFAEGVLYFGDGANANKDGKVTSPKYLFSADQKQGNASLKKLAARLEPRASEVKTLEFAHTGTLAGFEPLRRFASEH